jgi:hypothetical protein
MKTKTVFLLIVAILIIACKHKSSNDEALEHLDIILKNYGKIIKDRDLLNQLAPRYIFDILNNKTVDSSTLLIIRTTNETIIKNIMIAQKEINALSEINSKTNIKNGTLKYLNELLQFEQGFPFLLNMYDDKDISYAELKEISMLKESIVRIKTAGASLNILLNEFYNEYNFTDNQLQTLFSKYELE